MRKIIILGFIPFFLIKIGYGQDTIYFDSKWNKSSKINYSYYRIITPLKSKYIIEDYFASGQIQMKGISRSKDSIIKDGVFDYFSKNGIKNKTVTYKDNQKEGRYLLYYPNSTLKESGFYKNDHLSGKNIQYFENGIVKRECLLKYGMYNGKMTYYNESGIKIGEGKCKNDGWDGKWIKYDNDGNKLLNIFYGNLIKIKECRLVINSSNYIWSLFDKVVYQGNANYALKCISTSQNRKNLIENSPEVRLLIIDSKSVFDSCYTSIDKKNYKFSFSDKRLNVVESFITEFKNESDNNIKHLVIKFHNNKLNLILISTFNLDDLHRNNEIIDDLFKGISGY